MIPKLIPPAVLDIKARKDAARKANWDAHYAGMVSTGKSGITEATAKALMDLDDEEDRITDPGYLHRLGEFCILQQNIDLKDEMAEAGTVLSIARNAAGQVVEFSSGTWVVRQNHPGQKKLFARLEAICNLIENMPSQPLSVRHQVLRLRLQELGLEGNDRTGHVEAGVVLLGLVDAGKLDRALLPKIVANLRIHAWTPADLLAIIAAM